MKLQDCGTVVAEGKWVYADAVDSRVVIVRRDIHYGSGDHADPRDIAEDGTVETFEVLYASPTDPDDFIAGGGQYDTLEEAQSAAVLACGPTLGWQARP
ncbi:MAG: hypothetical protein HOW73_24150 [Polyangiaceae bacterium]|nr:hypothetical protein [Polyangiaceae bacterium]